MINYEEVLMNLIICILDSYIMMDFMTYYLGVKKNYRNLIWKIFYIGISGGLIFLINLLDHTVINLLSSTSINFIVILIFIDGALIAKIMYMSMIYAFQLLAEFTTVLLFQFGFSMENSIKQYDDILLILICKFGVYLIVVGFKQLFPRGNWKMQDKTFWKFLLIPFSSMGITIIIPYLNINLEGSPGQKILLHFFYVVLLLGNILIFSEFKSYSILKDEEKDMHELVTKQKTELKHYKLVEEINQKNAVFRHDINHYMKAIGELANEGDCVTIKEILKELEIGFRECENKIYCVDSLLNVMLNELIQDTKEKHIDLDFYVEPGFKLIGVKEADMVSLFSNLTQNAMEAAIKCKEPKIKLRIYTQTENSYAMMKIQNNYNEELRKQDDYFITSKKDSNNHGIGIKQVRQIIKKYNGFLKYDYDHEIFTTLLILQINNK